MISIGSTSGRALVLAFLLALSAGSGCQTRQEATTEDEATTGKAGAMTKEDQVARGQYIVNSAGCHDCHTPWTMTETGPGPDMTRLLSGHPAGMVMPPPPKLEAPWLWAGAATNTAFSGPWGVSYSPNLTPHTTGLSAWNEEIFVKAMRTGRHMGTSRPILPPMPWFTYRNMSDEDLKAMWAYLQTIPPLENQVPDAVIAQATPPGGAPAGAEGH